MYSADPPSGSQRGYYVRNEEAKEDRDLWTATHGQSLITDEDAYTPRTVKIPQHRSPSPGLIRRGANSKPRSKRTRFEDDHYYSSESDFSMREEERTRRVTRPWHTSSIGSAYTANEGSTVYAFSPTRASRAPSSSRTANTIEEEAERSENGSESQDIESSRIRATYVFESQYTGESRLGDPHTVRLSVQRATAAKQKHLFRWM